MNELFLLISPWLLSIITVAQVYTIGNKWKYAHLFAIVVQITWWPWIILSETWGFVPLNVCMIVLGFINHRKWMNDDKDRS
jgi:hypothetical protein